ncbi:MAG: hypothetical protein RIE59_04230 [Imperialibacter sp.]
MRIKFLLIVGSIGLLACCHEKDKYPQGTFPATITNFSEVNSEYDDYNSDIPLISVGLKLHFSSNRNSAGENFDVVGDALGILWTTDNGTLSIHATSLDDDDDFTPELLSSINTPCNEMGPYSFQYNAGGKYRYVLMYASDCDSNFDISYAHHEKPFGTDGSPVLYPPKKIDFLNSSSDDMYPTFYGENFIYHGELAPETIEKLLFCSNRDGQFDIYEIGFGEDTDLAGLLGSDIGKQPDKLAISSESNDKCPFVSGKLLVFTSDRPGGFGGYDLYYCLRTDNGWSEPTNFGADVNSAYDDYRPVVLNYPGFFNNSLLLFSSNRPGGKGGFDLYYVGTDVAVY